MAARTNGKMVIRQHGEGPAAMLAMGTANPTNLLLPQDVFTDNLFRLSKCDHLTELKEKMNRICKRTHIHCFLGLTIICMFFLLVTS